MLQAHLVYSDNDSQELYSNDRSTNYYLLNTSHLLLSFYLPKPFSCHQVNKYFYIFHTGTFYSQS